MALLGPAACPPRPPGPLARGRWAPLGLALVLCSCALPGPPRPRATNPTPDCPKVTLAGLDDEGLRIDLHVPREHAFLGAELVVWRGLGPEPLPEPWTVLVLDTPLGATVAAGMPLAFLDTELPQTRPLELLYALEAPAPAACPLEPLLVHLPAAPLAPGPPRVEVLGLAVRIAAPDGATGTARLLRRSIHLRATEPDLLEPTWDLAEPYVDTTVEADGIYAYSLVITDTLRAQPGAVTLPLAGPRGPEAYAAVRHPATLVLPPEP